MIVFCCYCCVEIVHYISNIYSLLIIFLAENFRVLYWILFDEDDDYLLVLTTLNFFW